MSSFAKLVSIVLGASAILYLFICTSFLPINHNRKTINQDQIIEYVLKELTYEMAYGEKNINIDVFVDNAVKEALLKN